MFAWGNRSYAPRCLLMKKDLGWDKPALKTSLSLMSWMDSTSSFVIFLGLLSPKLLISCRLSMKFWWLCFESALVFIIDTIELFVIDFCRFLLSVVNWAATGMCRWVKAFDSEIVSADGLRRVMWNFWNLSWPFFSGSLFLSSLFPLWVILKNFRLPPASFFFSKIA